MNPATPILDSTVRASRVGGRQTVEIPKVALVARSGCGSAFSPPPTAASCSKSAQDDSI